MSWERKNYFSEEERKAKRLLEDISLAGGLLFDSVERKNIELMAENFSSGYDEMWSILENIKELYYCLLMRGYHHSDCAYLSPEPRSGLKFELPEIRTPYAWLKTAGNNGKDSKTDHSELRKLVTEMLRCQKEKGNFTLTEEFLFDLRCDHKNMTAGKLKIGRVFSPLDQNIYQQIVKPTYQKKLEHLWSRLHSNEDGGIGKTFLDSLCSQDYRLLYAKIMPIRMQRVFHPV